MNTSIEYLNSNEINAILREINNTRDNAIVALFLNTGILLSELVNLKTDSINWETKMLAISGSRQREIPLNDQAHDALARWSRERIDNQTLSLFITNKGQVKELSARSVEHLIQRYAEQAGISRRVNASILRNTFAVRLFSEAVSKDKAAAILGISDYESINRYALASKQPPKVELSTEDVSKVDTRPFLSKLISKHFPTTPKIAKPLNNMKGPILPDPEELVFGRESAIENIRLLLVKKQPVLLIGPLGIGKTHLLKHISRMLGPNTLYISSPTPLKNMLAQICDKLNPEWKKQLKDRSSAKDIIDFIIKSGDVRSFPILMIDNLDKLKAPDTDLFITLLEHFTTLGSTDEINPKLEEIWWKFKQIKLNPLSKEASKHLIKYLTQNLSISDYEMLETRILNISNGLPLAIVDMIRQIAHKPVITREIARDIYHEAGTRYRDWTPLLIVLWGAAMIFRFIALGTHSFEGYIMAGSLIAVLMTVIRFMRMVK